MTTARVRARTRRPGTICILAALCGLAPLACDSDDRAATIEREVYVETYVELLKAAAEAPDSAAPDSVSAVLQRRGLSETDLSDFALRHADDPGYMASVWGDIENRLRERPPRPDSAGEPPE